MDLDSVVTPFRRDVVYVVLGICLLTVSIWLPFTGFGREYYRYVRLTKSTTFLHRLPRRREPAVRPPTGR